MLLIAHAEPMRYLIYILFFGLALAVCDESVQKLTDRTSSTTDVMIDFGGLCIGIALAYFAFAVIRLIIKRKSK